MRTPGQLLTKAEQKEYGLSRSEARQMEKREKDLGKVLLGVSKFVPDESLQPAPKPSRVEVKAERKEVRLGRQEKKAAKKEAKTAKKEGYAGRDMEAILPEGERQKILAKEIKRLTKFGQPWKVKEINATTAVLFDPAAEPIGAGGALGILATGGLSLAVTPVRRGRENDRHLSVVCYPNGAIERSGYWVYNGMDYQSVPMLEL